MWTPERIEALKLLWACGRSAAQIAVELGGVTRSAVLGRVHRLALPRRRTVRRHPKHKPPGAKRMLIERPEPVLPLPLPPPPPAPPTTTVSARPRPLLKLTPMQCRWPITDGKPFLFCADPVETKPYCPHHRRMAYCR